VVSLLTFGEGYHNYHHTYQSDYRNGPRWYNFDPSKWLIFTLSLFGLAWSLRTPSAAEGKASNL
jgi:stearoyl-CoA desaturase (delta-9 desaturase)